MNLKECYDVIGGDYEGVTSRLMNEKIVIKFVRKFLGDPSYDMLLKSLEEGNNEEAFRAAHTIKGIAQNLSFTKLYESSSALADALRDGSDADEEQIEKVKSDYEQTVRAINDLEE